VFYLSEKSNMCDNISSVSSLQRKCF